jgi:hypothetical protein
MVRITGNLVATSPTPEHVNGAKRFLQSSRICSWGKAKEAIIRLWERTDTCVGDFALMASFKGKNIIILMLIERRP